MHRSIALHHFFLLIPCFFYLFIKPACLLAFCSECPEVLRLSQNIPGCTATFQWCSTAHNITVINQVFEYGRSVSFLFVLSFHRSLIQSFLHIHKPCVIFLINPPSVANFFLFLFSFFKIEEFFQKNGYPHFFLMVKQ